VATKWLEENEVAVESAIRNELASNFMEGLRDLFLENYIDIPEDAVDVVTELSAENKALEDKLNEAIAEIASLKQDITEATAEELFAEVATGLPASQVEKFRILSEGVEFLGDGDKYQEKLATIKTAHFKNETKRVPTVRFEDSFDERNMETLNENLDPQMKGYVGALSRYKPRQVEVKK
jgi:predicted nuclease with TOPRIM domain